MCARGEVVDERKPAARWPGDVLGGRQVPLSVMVMKIWLSVAVACRQTQPGVVCAVKACSAALARASYTARVRSLVVSSPTRVWTH